MICYGVLPMAGKAGRVQPLAFSKELYPVSFKGRHYAVSEFSIRAMLKAGVDEIRLVIHPEKMDIVRYYAAYTAPLSFYFYKSPSLPQSCIYPVSNVNDDDICLFGLPDTLFSGRNAYLRVRKRVEQGADVCLGVFKVEDASKFDSVMIDNKDRVRGVLVKKSPPLSSWIWGIWGARGKVLGKLNRLIKTQRVKGEKLLGKGFDRLAKDGKTIMVAEKLGDKYFDIGTYESLFKLNDAVIDFELL